MNPIMRVSDVKVAVICLPFIACWGGRLPAQHHTPPPIPRFTPPPPIPRVTPPPAMVPPHRPTAAPNLAPGFRPAVPAPSSVDFHRQAQAQNQLRQQLQSVHQTQRQIETQRLLSWQQLSHARATAQQLLAAQQAVRQSGEAQRLHDRNLGHHQRTIERIRQNGELERLRRLLQQSPEVRRRVKPEGR